MPLLDLLNLHGHRPGTFFDHRGPFADHANEPVDQAVKHGAAYALISSWNSANIRSNGGPSLRVCLATFDAINYDDEPRSDDRERDLRNHSSRHLWR